MVFSCVDLLFHGYLAFKEARGHQIVDNADDDPDDTNRVLIKSEMSCIHVLNS